MTEKRFVETVSTGIVTDTVTGKEYRCEMRIDEDLLELLNELHEENQELKRLVKATVEDYTDLKQSFDLIDKENEQLKQVVAETEKMLQSTYDELTKLRCFKKNVLRIKHSWDHLIEAMQYD